jgi:hypothetical protein
MKTDNIVLLNGTANAGKSTIAKALQEMMVARICTPASTIFCPGCPHGSSRLLREGARPTPTTS